MHFIAVVVEVVAVKDFGLSIGVFSEQSDFADLEIGRDGIIFNTDGNAYVAAVF